MKFPTVSRLKTANLPSLSDNIIRIFSVKDVLFLLSKDFPDNKGESFLQLEVEYLDTHFQKIYTLPFNRPDNFNTRYKNLEVISVINKKLGLKHKFYGLINFFFYYFFTELKRNFNYQGFLSILKTNISYFLSCYSRALEIERELNSKYPEFKNAIFYSYWLDENGLILTILKRRNKKIKAIGRGHGFDVFSEQARFGYNKFQASIIKYLDIIVSVSNKGTDYLKMKYPGEKKKIFTSYLGTASHENFNPITNDEIVIVSCAHIRPVKAIHKIPEALGMVNFKCRWIHLGGYHGEEYKRVVEQKIETACAQNKHLEIEIKGNLSPEEIFRFYKTVPISFFISVSHNEGLPVSMMEAISFGIPILSTDVGGCNEICVENVSGKLMPGNVESKELAQYITSFTKELNYYIYNRNKIKEFWKNRFCADINYKNFIKINLK